MLSEILQENGACLQGVVQTQTQKTTGLPAPPQVDFEGYQNEANLKLNEFERRLWGELDQAQINQFSGYMAEITGVRNELSTL